MRGLGVALLVVVVGACGSSRMPQPLPFQQNLTSALIEADFPPPPGRVEQIPAQPNDGAVWLDGEWVWQGGRWSWKRGRWVTPPPGAVFSPWTGTRNVNGTYYVAEGTWRDKDGKDVADPLPLAAAKTRGGGVVGPDGEDVPTTPNIRPDKQRDGRERDRHDAGAPEAPSGATTTGTSAKADAGARDDTDGGT